MTDLLSWKPNKSGRPKKAPRPRRAPPASEFKTCCALADTLDRFADRDWRWTHLPFGEKRSPITGARLKRMGTKPGWPDYIFLSPDGRVLFLEMKRRGEKQTPEQHALMLWCARLPIEAGVAHIVAHSYGEAVTTLKAWGVLPSTIKIS